VIVCPVATVEFSSLPAEVVDQIVEAVLIIQLQGDGGSGTGPSGERGSHAGCEAPSYRS
jgi:hypothetical protein